MFLVCHYFDKAECIRCYISISHDPGALPWWNIRRIISPFNRIDKKKKKIFNRLAVQQARTLQGFPGWWVGGTIQVFNLPGGSLFYGQGAHGCTTGTDT